MAPRPHNAPESSPPDASAKTRGSGLVKTLGLVSLGLGIPAAAAPDSVARAIGLRPTDGTKTLLRGVGVGAMGVAAVRLARGSSSAGSRALQIRRTVTVRKPTDEVYRHWRSLENLPDFMAHLESVEQRPGGRSHWVARAPAGTRVEWDAEITEDTPGELIAWRSVKRAKVENSGVVRFAPAPGEQGTEVSVELRYSPAGGRAGAAMAKLFGEAPEQQLADDLRRFKQVLETGEVVVSSGAPHGTTTQHQLRQRPAQPTAEGSR